MVRGLTSREAESQNVSGVRYRLSFPPPDSSCDQDRSEKSSAAQPQVGIFSERRPRSAASPEPVRMLARSKIPGLCPTMTAVLAESGSERTYFRISRQGAP